MRHLIISPHLDDAVISAYTLLVEPARLNALHGGDIERPAIVEVVNICCAVPDQDFLGRSDKLCNAVSSWAQMHKRLAEDRDVMVGLGISSYYLDVLDKQYRRDEPEPEAASIAKLIAAAAPVDEKTAVWMPWAYQPDGQATHPDHLLVRRAAEQFVRDADVSARYYYADMPYLFRQSIAAPGVVDDGISVVSAVAGRGKLHACRAYATQWRYLRTKWRHIRRERYIRVSD